MCTTHNILEAVSPLCLTASLGQSLRSDTRGITRAATAMTAATDMPDAQHEGM